jgi:hypothetical protein
LRAFPLFGSPPQKEILTVSAAPYRRANVARFPTLGSQSFVVERWRLFHEAGEEMVDRVAILVCDEDGAIRGGSALSHEQAEALAFAILDETLPS